MLWKIAERRCWRESQNEQNCNSAVDKWRQDSDANWKKYVPSSDKMAGKIARIIIKIRVEEEDKREKEIIKLRENNNRE